VERGNDCSAGEGYPGKVDEADEQLLRSCAAVDGDEKGENGRK
jgi:hypothetical protein